MRAEMIHFNTLCCEPVIVRAPDGSLVVLCQCDGKTEPDKENRVYVFRSADGGKSWSNGNKWRKGELLCPDDGKAVYCTGAYTHDGVITAFITKHNGAFLDWECRLYHSRDNGKSWTDGGINPWFIGFVFIRGDLVLPSGKRAIAYQHYRVTKAENRRLKKENKRIMDACIDNVECGLLVEKTDGNFVPRTPVLLDMKSGWVWAEPTLALLSDGTVAMLMRKDNSGALWRADTADEGKTWSKALKTDIPNPANKPFLINHTNGKIYLINTPNSVRDERYPFAIWETNDDMKSWTEKTVISDIPAFWSYSWAVVSDDGSLSVVFEDRHNLYFTKVTV